jgi:hypothetical protein
MSEPTELDDDNKYSGHPSPASPVAPAPLTDYNERLELAKQRVAIVERVMKLPYIKATRNASVGQERFVARDDLITLIHDYAKVSRAGQAPAPIGTAPLYCGTCNMRRYFVDGKCEVCALAPKGEPE